MGNKYFVSFVATEESGTTFWGNATVYYKKIKDNDDILEIRKTLIENNKDVALKDICILFWKRYE